MSVAVGFRGEVGVRVFVVKKHEMLYTKTFCLDIRLVLEDILAHAALHKGHSEKDFLILAK